MSSQVSGYQKIQGSEFQLVLLIVIFNLPCDIEATKVSDQNIIFINISNFISGVYCLLLICKNFVTWATPQAFFCFGLFLIGYCAFALSGHYLLFLTSDSWDYRYVPLALVHKTFKRHFSSPKWFFPITEYNNPCLCLFIDTLSLG
jgi:hypothetical protein